MPIDAARRAGPKLSDATSRAINAAVVEELATTGFARLTVEAVARRAAVGKAAVYRRWPSKEGMVLASLEAYGVDEEAAPDTGSLAGDVDALLSRLREQLSDPVVARVVPDLLAETARDPTFGAAIFARVGAARRENARALVRRGVSRGELKPGCDEELAVDSLAAALYWRLVVTRQPFSDEDQERLVRFLIAGMRAA